MTSFLGSWSPFRKENEGAPSSIKSPSMESRNSRSPIKSPPNKPFEASFTGELPPASPRLSRSSSAGPISRRTIVHEEYSRAPFAETLDTDDSSDFKSDTSYLASPTHSTKSDLDVIKTLHSVENTLAQLQKMASEKHKEGQEACAKAAIQPHKPGGGGATGGPNEMDNSKAAYYNAIKHYLRTRHQDVAEKTDPSFLLVTMRGMQTLSGELTEESVQKLIRTTTAKNKELEEVINKLKQQETELKTLSEDVSTKEGEHTRLTDRLTALRGQLTEAVAQEPTLLTELKSKQKDLEILQMLLKLQREVAANPSSNLMSSLVAPSSSSTAAQPTPTSQTFAAPTRRSSINGSNAPMSGANSALRKSLGAVGGGSGGGKDKEREKLEKEIENLQGQIGTHKAETETLRELLVEAVHRQEELAQDSEHKMSLLIELTEQVEELKAALAAVTQEVASSRGTSPPSTTKSRKHKSKRTPRRSASSPRPSASTPTLGPVPRLNLRAVAQESDPSEQKATAVGSGDGFQSDTTEGSSVLSDNESEEDLDSSFHLPSAALFASQAILQSATPPSTKKLPPFRRISVPSSNEGGGGGGTNPFSESESSPTDRQQLQQNTSSPGKIRTGAASFSSRGDNDSAAANFEDVKRELKIAQSLLGEKTEKIIQLDRELFELKQNPDTQKAAKQTIEELKLLVAERDKELERFKKQPGSEVRSSGPERIFTLEKMLEESQKQATEKARQVEILQNEFLEFELVLTKLQKSGKEKDSEISDKSNEVEKLRVEVENLRLKLENAHKETKKPSGSPASAPQATAESERVISELKSEIEKLKSSVNQPSTPTSGVEISSGGGDQSSTHVEVENQKLKSQVEELKSEIEMLKIEISENEPIMAELAEDVDRMKASVSKEKEMRKALEDALSSKDQELSRLRSSSTVESSPAQLTQPHVEGSNLAPDANFLPSDNEEHERKIEDLVQQVFERDQKISELKLRDNYFAESRKMLDQTKDELQDAKEKMRELENTLTEKEAEINKLQALLSYSGSHHSTEAFLRTQLENREEEGKALRQALEISTGEIQQNQKDMSDLRSELLTIHAHVDDLTTELSAAKEQVDAKQGVISSVMEEKEKLIKLGVERDEKISQMRKENEQNVAKIESFKLEVEKCRDEIDALTQDLDGAHSELESLKMENENQSKLIQDLEKNLADCEEKIEDLQRSLTKKESEISSLVTESRETQKSLTSARERLENQLTQKDHQLSESNLRCEVLTEKLAHSETISTEMETKLFETVEILREIERENGELNSTCETLKQENGDLCDRLKGETRERERLQAVVLEKENVIKRDEAVVREAQARLDAKDREISDIQKQLSDTSLRLTQSRNRIKSLENLACALKREARAKGAELRAEVRRCSDLNRINLNQLKDVMNSQVQSMAQRYKTEFDFLTAKYKKEMIERKKLFNLVQELRGNIRVFCRVRPLLGAERDTFTPIPVYPDDNEICITGESGGRKVPYSFTFDRVFQSEISQQDVFEEVKPLVTSIMDGYAVCIMAYGQTGSGKTFTMEGPEHDRGVNHRTLHELFLLREERKTDFSYDIRVSVMEIYNENIFDLLSSAKNPREKKLDVRLAPGGGVVVPELTQVSVASAEDVLRVLSTGNRNRSVGETKMNEHSSRSHCILSVYVKGTNLISGAEVHGKLHLVDLAGSERVGKSEVKGDSLKEAQAINKSLAALGDTMSALASKSSHVPYRNSKLTYLLQDSLGGDSKTLMFVNISPTQPCVQETLCSLNFASRVRTVELGPAKKRTSASSSAPMPSTPRGEPAS